MKKNELSETNVTGFSDENILEDDYPVYCGYCYVCDGKMMRSQITGCVKDLKKDGVKEVRRCNIVDRTVEYLKGVK